MNTMKKKETETTSMNRMNHAKVTTSPQQQMAGLNCPRCQLRLSIDPQKSKTALNALGKIQAAQRQLEHPKEASEGLNAVLSPDR